MVTGLIWQHQGRPAASLYFGEVSFHPGDKLSGAGTIQQHQQLQHMKIILQSVTYRLLMLTARLKA